MVVIAAPAGYYHRQKRDGVTSWLKKASFILSLTIGAQGA